MNLFGSASQGLYTLDYFYTCLNIFKLDPKRAISLMGVRRTGKTTLLLQLQKHLEGTYNVLYRNIEEGIAYTSSELLQEILNSGCSFALVDEITRLSDFPNVANLLDTLYLRGVTLVMCGTETFLFHTNEYLHSAFGRTHSVYLRPLDIRDVLDLGLAHNVQEFLMSPDILTSNVISGSTIDLIYSLQLSLDKMNSLQNSLCGIDPLRLKYTVYIILETIIREKLTLDNLPDEIAKEYDLQYKQPVKIHIIKELLDLFIRANILSGVPRQLVTGDTHRIETVYYLSDMRYYLEQNNILMHTDKTRGDIFEAFIINQVKKLVRDNTTLRNVELSSIREYTGKFEIDLVLTKPDYVTGITKILLIECKYSKKQKVKHFNNQALLDYLYSAFGQDLDIKSFKVTSDTDSVLSLLDEVLSL